MKKQNFIFTRHKILHLLQCPWKILFNISGKALMWHNPYYEMHKLACDRTFLFELCHPALDWWVGARCVCFAMEGDPNISRALVIPTSPYPSILVANLHHFWQNVMEKKNAVTNSLIFVQKTPKMNKIAQNRHNCYNMTGCLRLFYFSIFEYRQIWLNILRDDCHLSNITKLKKEKTLEFQRFRLQTFRLMLSTSGPNP